MGSWSTITYSFKISPVFECYWLEQTHYLSVRSETLQRVPAFVEQNRKQLGLSVLQDLKLFDFALVLLVVESVLEENALVQATADLGPEFLERVVFFFEAHGDVLVDEVDEEIQGHLSGVADDRVRLALLVR